MSDASERDVATEQDHTDQGVPVGSADVEADIERASGESGKDSDRDDWRDQGVAESSTDQGVPVGAADAEEDRRRAAGGD